MGVKTDKQMRFKPSYKQLTIDGFRSSLEGLDKTNRWVWLGDHLPWVEYEKLYGQTLNNQTAGASGKPARMVIGAMIVKHITRLSDQDTIEMIQENPYMQYLCGLGEFTDQPIFDSSLFVDLRKRISADDINKMTEALLKREQQMKEEMRKHKEDEARDRGEEPPAAPAVDENAAAFTDSKGREHKGVLKIDATCADAEVRYPVDVDIIDDGCRVMDRFIRRICKADSISVPYTYYGKARNAYRYLVKMKKKGGKLVKDTIEQMLSCLHRDILTLIDLTAGEFRYRLDCLRKDQRRILDATMKMNFQQEQMFRTGEHRCKDRIVSIFQPHVRPIVRGKVSAKVEFGAKIGVSIVEGYNFIDHHSWDAYNEGADLQLQIDKYKERFGCLPATILSDKIYMNRANRAILKDLEIKNYYKPLGRPPKEPPSPERQAMMAKAVGQRNEIECSFGTGKRVYQANDIRAKLPETAECWTGMCYFAKNVMKFFRELCHTLYDLLKFLTLVTIVGTGLRPAWQVEAN
ncbi:MAG: IS5 family transposase [Prevotella sp.]|nr:IS5 family transposase [Prevotella sp.]